jgi:glycosyltransferase involved in cell wall biosynthesis
MNAPSRPKIALGLEYPLAMRGGVSVLVEELIRGLAPHYRIVLVSPDSRAAVAAQPICEHVVWKPEAVSRRSSRALAERLAGTGVVLAHFHSGGNYGWGNRIPGQSPIPYLARNGVACVSTIHLVVSILDGYCAPQKPLWLKLALLPIAWLGKMHVLRHVRREIAVSRHDCAKVRCWYWPLRSRFAQIYHSRIEATEADSHRRAKPHAARQPVVLSVGHIAFRKGQHILADAFARIAERHPGWQLLLIGPVGESACREQIESIAARHNLGQRIVLAGERPDAIDFMQTASVYVQPSIWEALGLALQEALFHGCACIGTRAGGIPELIQHQANGLLVNANDSADMTRALDGLMSDASLREQFAGRGPESVLSKGMTVDGMIRKHLELYMSILDEG